jgi:signal transduction histidine kinase
MLRGQAEERRRLGRELHDSTSQLLASVGLLLGRLKRQHPQPEWLGVVDELQGIVRDAQEEIRSITFLTHPPILDQMGLTDALSALVQGMGRRTGLEVTFEVRGSPVSLSTALQGAIYRVAQECLSNVQRHSHAKKARVCLCFRKWAVHLVVGDNGLGIPIRAAGRRTEGVGLAGMRSRLAEMGGRLSITALQTGTAVTASMRYIVAQPASKNAALSDFAA